MTVSETNVAVVGVVERDFQCEVLGKLGRLEAKMDMLAGNGQPGRMQLAEDRLIRLEYSDVRRTVIERFVNAGIAVFVSAAVAMHRFWWK